MIVINLLYEGTLRAFYEHTFHHAFDCGKLVRADRDFRELADTEKHGEDEL